MGKKCWDLGPEMEIEKFGRVKEKRLEEELQEQVLELLWTVKGQVLMLVVVGLLLVAELVRLQGLVLGMRWPKAPISQTLGLRQIPCYGSLREKKESVLK